MHALPAVNRFTPNGEHVIGMPVAWADPLPGGIQIVLADGTEIGNIYPTNGAGEWSNVSDGEWTRVEVFSKTDGLLATMNIANLAKQTYIEVLDPRGRVIGTVELEEHFGWVAKPVEKPRLFSQGLVSVVLQSWVNPGLTAAALALWHHKILTLPEEEETHA